MISTNPTIRMLTNLSYIYVYIYDGVNNMCTKIFPNPSGQIVHNHNLALRKIKNSPPKLGIICERYWSYL